jgi:hypothetical protein
VNDLFNLVRALHIANGATALIIAPPAMITVKGDYTRKFRRKTPPASA